MTHRVRNLYFHKVQRLLSVADRIPQIDGAGRQVEGRISTAIAAHVMMAGDGLAVKGFQMDTGLLWARRGYVESNIDFDGLVVSNIGLNAYFANSRIIMLDAYGAPGSDGHENGT